MIFFTWIDEFHKADLDRARTNDTWIGRFLSYNDMNMQNALDQLLEACAWRKDFGVNGAYTILLTIFFNDYASDVRIFRRT